MPTNYVPTNNESPTSAHDLAALRTEWASERTRLANERTLIAWLRTGLAVTAFGAVVPQLLSSVQPEWLVRFIAILFVASGSVVLYYGVRTYREMTGRLGEDQIGMPWRLVALLAGSLEIGAIMILALFLFS